MYVPAVGPTNARIAIVGEAPGAEEAARGEPFVGASGQLLNSMLAAVGISRQECYITNVVKQRPPNNDFGIFYVDKQRRQPSTHLEQSIQELKDELTRVKPNVIVPLGGEALRALTGRYSIEKYRGSILQSSVGKCVGTYHPAYILRQYTARAIAEFDLRRVLEESRSPELNLPKHEFVLRPTFADVMIFLDKLRKVKRFSFDIETTQNMVRCLGISFDPGSAISIPFIASPVEPTIGSSVLYLGDTKPAGDVRNSYWPEDQEYEILRRLYDLFIDPSIQKVAQNSPFDMCVLERDLGIITRNLWLDTMVAWHTCYAELPKGLDFLCSILTRVPYYSDYDVASDQSTWLYNCYDAAVTLEIVEPILSELDSLGLREFYFHHMHPAILAVTRAEQRGIRVDQTARAEHAERIRKIVEQTTARMREIVGKPDFNPNSPKQVSDYLYGTLRLKPELRYDPKTKERKPTTDKNAIRALKRKYPKHEEFFTCMQEFSEKETLLSGFLEKPLGKDGRIRTHYNVAGTVTRRWSSSEPLFEPGTNLQNIPVRTAEGAKVRASFIADEGFWLSKWDLSQAEFRIVMWMGKVRRVIDRYLHDPNFDCHKWVASLIYRKPEAEITKEERSDGKNGVYGGNYGMQYRRASMVYKIPEDKAKFVLETYRRELWEVPKWWEEVQRTIMSTRMIVSPTGGKRIFFDRISDDLFRDAYSHSAQSIVADLMTRAFTLASEIFDPDECWPCLQTHDEILFQVRKGMLLKYEPRIRNLMSLPLQFPGVPEPLIIPPDGTYGPNWYDQKPIPEVEPC